MQSKAPIFRISSNERVSHLSFSEMGRYTFHVALSTDGNYSVQDIDAKQHVILFIFCIFEILLPT